MEYSEYKQNQGQGVKIAVLDSGVDISNIQLKNVDFEKSVGFVCDEDEVIFYSNASDDLGHGTAVTSIITKLVPKVKIYSVKVIENGIVSDEKVLIAAMKYIEQHVPCDIINISIGLLYCDEIEEFEAVCQRLCDKGIIIVAAFDNGGAISYPATFGSVIGIDSYRAVGNKNDYYKTDNKMVDYIGIDKEQWVPWANHEMQMVSGNSFVAPYFTAMIAKIIQNSKKTLGEIKNILNENAKKNISFMSPLYNNFNLKINNAITFPFNKEIHSLARYKSLLKFNIIDFYDSKYAGQISKKVSDILESGGQNDLSIKNIDSLDWSGNFDTVILGHISELSEVCGIDYEKIIIEKCIEHNKQLYSLRDIRTHSSLMDSLKYYCPYVELPNGSLINKMFCIGKPVLGIVGTSSRQGKFSLQIELRNFFEKQGYVVGYLGTEPTALLFGADAIYPMGYESSVYTKGLASVYVVNHLMGEIEKKQPDIILFGSQSHTIPKYIGGLKQYPIFQHELILGCQADAYILCVSVDDSVEYIHRTIMYLESIYSGKVIALALAPIESTLRWSVLSNKKNLILKEQAFEAITNFKTQLNIPVYSWNDTEQFQQLADLCVEYFAD